MGKQNKKDIKHKNINLNEEEYEIEKILEKRIVKNKIEYLIKWKDYPESDNTWEPIENMDNAKRMISEFEKKLKEKKTKNIINYFNEAKLNNNMKKNYKIKSSKPIRTYKTFENINTEEKQIQNDFIQKKRKNNKKDILPVEKSKENEKKKIINKMIYSTLYGNLNTSFESSISSKNISEKIDDKNKNKEKNKLNIKKKENIKKEKKNEIAKETNNKNNNNNNNKNNNNNNKNKNNNNNNTEENLDDYYSRLIDDKEKILRSIKEEKEKEKAKKKEKEKKKNIIYEEFPDLDFTILSIKNLFQSEKGIVAITLVKKKDEKIQQEIYIMTEAIQKYAPKLLFDYYESIIGKNLPTQQEMGINN